MAETTHTEWRRGQFREQRDPFFTTSVQFVGLILPSSSHAEIWTRLHACAISSDIWRSGCVTSAIFRMACITLKWGLHLVPYYQPSTPARFLSIIDHWDVSLPLSWNSRCDRHREEITIMQFIGHSLPVHHFFSTVRIFLPCLILWAKLYFTCEFEFQSFPFGLIPLRKAGTPLSSPNYRLNSTTTLPSAMVALALNNP